MPYYAPYLLGGRLVPLPDRLEEVGAGHPSPAVKAAAEAALRAAALDLGLPASTRIIWCIDESETSREMRRRHGDDAPPWRTVEVPQPCRGMVDPAEPDVLWVRADQSPAEAADTTRHEARHAWQLQKSARRWQLPGLGSMEGRETDAEAYANRPPPSPPAAARTEAPRQRADQAVVRASRTVNARKEFQCERCTEWMRVGVTHHCPAATGPAVRSGALIHVVKGVHLADCRPCGGLVRVGTTHRCPAATKLGPPLRGPAANQQYDVKVIR